VEKTRDASNRCLPPIRTVCTRTSRVPGSLSRLSPCGRPTETKAPCGITGGPDVSRHPRPLRRIVVEHVTRALLPHGLETRAWAFSSHGIRCDRASDTPVANPSSSSRLGRLRACCNLAVRPPFERFGTGRRMWRPPRPPLTPSRESRRLVMIRDAFYRQGPFVGSGGHYSPGPATLAPLLAMRKPLDDDLSPPWAFAPVLSRLQR
jgi:hypothetical protein